MIAVSITDVLILLHYFLLQSDAGHVQLVSVTLDRVLDAVTFGTNGTDDFTLLGSLDISQPLIIINSQVLAGKLTLSIQFV